MSLLVQFLHGPCTSLSAAPRARHVCVSSPGHHGLWNDATSSTLHIWWCCIARGKLRTVGILVGRITFSAGFRRHWSDRRKYTEPRVLCQNGVTSVVVCSEETQTVRQSNHHRMFPLCPCAPTTHQGRYDKTRKEWHSDMEVTESGTQYQESH